MIKCGVGQNHRITLFLCLFLQVSEMFVSINVPNAINRLEFITFDTFDACTTFLNVFLMHLTKKKFNTSSKDNLFKNSM